MNIAFQAVLCVQTGSFTCFFFCFEEGQVEFRGGGCRGGKGGGDWARLHGLPKACMHYRVG